MFSDEIINYILSFREKHPIQKLIEPLVESYANLESHIIWEYYHENVVYECSFVEWYFLYRKINT